MDYTDMDTAVAHGTRANTSRTKGKILKDTLDESSKETTAH